LQKSSQDQKFLLKSTLRLIPKLKEKGFRYIFYEFIMAVSWQIGILKEKISPSTED